MKKYYYIYQITNLVNNKIYVGVHKTSDLSDGYMGSGKVIKDAIRKYGIDNFRKDILETFENAEAMYAREKEIVTDEFLLREDVYNLRRGGSGGFDLINKIGKNRNNTLTRIDCINGGKNSAVNSSKRMKQLHALKKIPYNNFKHKKHTEKTKQTIGIKNSKHQQGKNNSQYGTIWITDGVKNKKIKKEEPIPKGWNKGRK